MKYLIILVMVALTGGISRPVQAQMLMNADDIAYQPQIRRDDSGFSSCGVRVIAIVPIDKASDIYDFSINIYADSVIALIKAGKSTASNADIARGLHNIKPIAPGPKAFWIALESKGKAMNAYKLTKSDTPGYVMGGVDLEQALEIIYAMINGGGIQFAARYSSQRVDSVVAFSKPLSDRDKTPLMACFVALFDRMQQELKDK